MSPMAEEGGIGGFLLFVDFDEATLVLFDFRVFQTQIVAARHPADGDQDPVINFFACSLCPALA